MLNSRDNNNFNSDSTSNNIFITMIAIYMLTQISIYLLLFMPTPSLEYKHESKCSIFSNFFQAAVQNEINLLRPHLKRRKRKKEGEGRIFLIKEAL